MAMKSVDLDLLHCFSLLLFLYFLQGSNASDFLRNDSDYGAWFDEPTHDFQHDTELMWGYKSALKPDLWKNSFLECGRPGQSPIAIFNDMATEDKDLGEFHLGNYFSPIPCTLKIKNTGHFLHVDIEYQGEEVKVTGHGYDGVYTPRHMYLHWGSNVTKGSEHTLEWRQYPMEIQIAHFANNKDMAKKQEDKPPIMVAFFFEEVSKDNKKYSAFVNSLKEVREPDSETVVMYGHLGSLLPDNTHGSLQYHYTGSQTYPNCRENIPWIVFTKTIPISRTQLEQFRRLMSHDVDTLGNNLPMSDNFRPLQAFNSRKLSYPRIVENVPRHYPKQEFIPEFFNNEQTGNQYAQMETSTFKHDTNAKICAGYGAILPEFRDMNESLFVLTSFRDLAPFPLGVKFNQSAGNWMYVSDSEPADFKPFIEWQNGWLPEGNDTETDKCAIVARGLNSDIPGHKWSGWLSVPCDTDSYGDVTKHLICQRRGGYWDTDPTTGRQFLSVEVPSVTYYSYYNSADLCAANGGHLPLVWDNDTADVIDSHGPDLYMTSWNDIMQAGRYVSGFDTGNLELGNYSNWLQPPANEHQQCVAVARTHKFVSVSRMNGWIAVNCEEDVQADRKSLVCERRAGWQTDPRTGKQYLMQQLLSERPRSENNDICKANGGFLPEPNDEQEFRFLQDLQPLGFLLGIDYKKSGSGNGAQFNSSETTSEGIQGTWTYLSSGEPLTWYKEEEDDAVETVEKFDCVMAVAVEAMDEDTDDTEEVVPMRWTDVKCGSQWEKEGVTSLLCQRDPGQHDTWIMDDSANDTGKKYLVRNKVPLHQPTLRQICINNGGFLPEPRSEREFDFIAGLTDDVFLLGVSDRAKEGDWRFDSDNANVTWFQWREGVPDGGSDVNCVLVDGANKMDDVKCNEVSGSEHSTLVCERLPDIDWAWSKDFAQCKDDPGSSQSPVVLDIHKAKVDLELVSFQFLHWNKPFKMQLINTGQALSLDAERHHIYLLGGNLVGKYQLKRVDFHWGPNNNKGTEHLIVGDNSPYVMEIQYVCYKAKYSTFQLAEKQDGGLAVLAFVVKLQEEDNPNFKKIVSALKHVRKAGSAHMVDNVAANTLFSDVSDEDLGLFYRYNGSLTAPPCTESVTWSVLKRPLKMSNHQVQEFRTLRTSTTGHVGQAQLMLDTRRPVKKLNNRTVVVNFEIDDENDLGMIGEGNLWFLDSRLVFVSSIFALFY